jgi:DNA (cytosine-5)-methyltransferase 1
MSEENGRSVYKSIDLFAGLGGIRMGFEQAFGNDIETNFVCEWDENAQKTYKTNYHDDFSITGDITQVNEKSIPPFDMCLAGFPCQAFSIAGRKQGFEDDYKGRCRGTLFFDVARICAYHKPKVIFCENVKGLTIHDKGNTLRVIRETLEQLGYNVYYRVLNSKDFGVPQNRERIYIVAFRKDIGSSGFRFPIGHDSGSCIKDIMERNVPSVKYYISDVYLDTLKRHRARHESKGNGFGYVIRGQDEIAGAIVCGGMGKERNLIIDNRLTDFKPVTHIKGQVNRLGVRKMTPREWARLQGFPDSYQFPLADVHSYRQLGNSVTVPVIEAIAEQIKLILDGKIEPQPAIIQKTVEEWA